MDLEELKSKATLINIEVLKDLKNYEEAFNELFFLVHECKVMKK